MTKRRVKRNKVFCSWCGKGNTQTEAMLKLNKHDLHMCWTCMSNAYAAMLTFIWGSKKK